MNKKQREEDGRRKKESECVEGELKGDMTNGRRSEEMRKGKTNEQEEDVQGELHEEEEEEDEEKRMGYSIKDFFKARVCLYVCIFI